MSVHELSIFHEVSVGLCHVQVGCACPNGVQTQLHANLFRVPDSLGSSRHLVSMLLHRTSSTSYLAGKY
jgi:hypothetical protein